MKKRRWEERIALGFMLITAAIILVSLFWILGTILVRGVSALNWSMIFQTPKGGYYLGKEGGILNAILGSLFLAGGATLIALVVALPVAFYLNVFLRNGSRLAGFARFSLDVMSGIPSIVFGAVGFILMTLLGLRTSLLAGMLTVALLILPIMIRAMDEVFRLVPREILEASFALGANRYETSMRVMIRQCFPGIVTAVLLALGRGIGDAASVLFTAGFTDHLPDSLFRPAATLPLAILFQVESPLPQVQKRAYAAALILTLIILIISLVSRWISSRFSRHIIR